MLTYLQLTYGISALGCWDGHWDIEELHRCLHWRTPQMFTAEDTDARLFCVFFFSGCLFIWTQIINCCIYITLRDTHYYMSLGNKWSSKDGFYTFNMHAYKGILFIFNGTQNAPQLLLTNANFGKAWWLSYLLLFLLRSLFLGTILAWPQRPQVALALEEASLVEGNVSAVVYNHLGNIRWFVLRALTMLRVSLPWPTLFHAVDPWDPTVFSDHLWLILYPSVCWVLQALWFSDFWYATCF